MKQADAIAAMRASKTVRNAEVSSTGIDIVSFNDDDHTIDVPRNTTTKILK
jgi:hypothetical protein